jgi:hypothetical protein
MDTCRQKKSGLTGDSIVGLHFSSQILNDSVNLWLIACIHVSNLGDAGAVENFPCEPTFVQQTAVLYACNPVSRARGTRETSSPSTK